MCLADVSILAHVPMGAKFDIALLNACSATIAYYFSH